MEQITRRKALTVIPAIGAAVTMPAAAVAAEPEHPWIKARRLAKELAATLDECDGGAWMAEIWPRGNLSRPAVLFGDIDAITADEEHDRELFRLGSELEKAWGIERDLSERKVYLDGPEGEAEWERAIDATGAIVDQIEAAQAHSFAGLRVKAQAISWCHCARDVALGPANAATDVRIANSIIASLLA